ncbi:DM13 domain-containing protein [Pseudonocardia sp. CA-107938]|uniref:DM13 domain-containing protein n=1 Tax=Pseudonocardia sp. CA-107938 TaxID=3240021 RepID=UPI003D945BB7
MRSLLRRPVVMSGLVVAAVLAVVALLVFEPWKLVVDQRVDEAAPAPPVAASAAPAVLARGELVAHEHASSGTVEVLALSDGSRVLRLQDLRTSNGPKLKVWLSDQPVLPGRDGWFVFDDGRHVDLGDLKGNIGSSNYAVPADVDLLALGSVTIWCDRFSVSFAAARLVPA